MATDFTIRPYQPGDLEPVAALWRASWDSTGVMPAGAVPLDELRDRLPREIAGGWEVHVGLVSGAVIGFCALAGHSLEQLFVAPAHQRRGFGKRLLDRVKQLRPMGFTLTTAADSLAWRFYEREGLTRGESFPHPRFGFTKYAYAWRPDP